MGSSASKAVRAGARKYPHRAPGSTPPPATGLHPPSPTDSSLSSPSSSNHITPKPFPTAEDTASDSPSQSFASRLHQMGIVKPNPTFSPSSTALPASPIISSSSGPRTPQLRVCDGDIDSGLMPLPFSASSSPSLSSTSTTNPTLEALRVRVRLREQATREFELMGQEGFEGRELLDVRTITDVLVRRRRGQKASEIEARLSLKPGVVGRLGEEGVVYPI